MKNQRTHITRFLIIVAIALIGCYAGLTAIRTAGADSTKKAAPPMPALRGPAAIRHLEQTGLYNTLSHLYLASLPVHENRSSLLRWLRCAPPPADI